ncbi:ABC transporter ATP-binding protein [Kurthia gibsonii]|uniref:ABC transporter ATP-binding protein n=1 Tax=Kurthia gibsonii TaxID=33946 RepID=A0ABU9LJD2_9BACL|nr:ABC transporter ATP-binding protein [Kurthia gibsonii]
MIHIDHIHKKFGTHTVLNDISIKIEEGQIFGLLGQNGAGKTTLMKIMLGLLKADQGDVRILGESVRFGNTPTNQHVGYLPDVPSFYPYMTAYEYLLFCGEVTGLDKKVRVERAKRYLALVGLPFNRKRIGGFSRGMKQRLGIAQALIHQPKVLICDEPTSALDPVGRREMIEILQKIKHETTVIFSTHILSDAEKICDCVAFLHNGTFQLSGKVSDILKQHQKPILRVVVQQMADAEKLKPLLTNATQSGTTFTIPSTNLLATQQQIFEQCIQQQIAIQSIEIEQSTLEDVFLEVIQS